MDIKWSSDLDFNCMPTIYDTFNSIFVQLSLLNYLHFIFQLQDREIFFYKFSFVIFNGNRHVFKRKKKENQRYHEEI